MEKVEGERERREGKGGEGRKGLWEEAGEGWWEEGGGREKEKWRKRKVSYGCKSLGEKFLGCCPRFVIPKIPIYTMPISFTINVHKVPIILST